MEPGDGVEGRERETSRWWPVLRWLRRRSAPGFTLVEIVVVLVVLGLSAALVAPALLPPREEGPSASLWGVIAWVQDMALRRGETLVLEVTPDGSWTAFGASSLEVGPLGAGELDGDPPRHGFSLRVGPLGSCGLTLEADTLGWRPPVDPLTCRVVSP